MKFRLKITLCMLALLSLLFGVGGSLLIAESFRDSLEREQEAAFDVYRMVWSALPVVDIAVSLDNDPDREGIRQIMEQLEAENGSAWTALRLATADEIIYESADAAAQAINFASPAGLPQPGECLFYTTAGPSGRHYLILAGAAVSGGDNNNEVLYLYTANDIFTLYEMRQAQQRTYLRVFLALAALCAILVYTAAGLLTAPLRELSQASRALASGDLTGRVQVRSDDEVGAVAQDFNTMASQLEEKVQELENAIDRQERFVGSFAHELKTPMTSLIGYAELLRSGRLNPEEQAEAVYYIYAEGKRLENLSHKLLELLVLKHKDMPLSKLRPAELIEGLIERLGPIFAARNITLSCDCQKGTCYLEPDLVWSLLLNLADNAQKAMEKGGHIHFRLQMLPDGCRIYVLDNGPGIPEAALNHLTEAFYRADKARSREQGGFGLGLALCQEIVELHNGRLKFMNQPQGGACIMAELRGGRP